jgi:hypothetical protein
VRGGERLVRAKFTHKIGLGILVGLVLFGVFFTATYGFVTANNAIAVSAQNSYNRMMNATAPIVLPFDPPWAFPLLIGFVGFIIPIAGIISMDFDEREAEKTA